MLDNYNLLIHMMQVLIFISLPTTPFLAPYNRLVKNPPSKLSKAQLASPPIIIILIKLYSIFSNCFESIEASPKTYLYILTMKPLNMTLYNSKCLEGIDYIFYKKVLQITLCISLLKLGFDIGSHKNNRH